MVFEDSTKLTTEKMENSLQSFRHRVRKIRTGRAHASLVESIPILYYGSQTPLSQMANISSLSARSLIINPWDIKALKNIEQALVKANLGMNPVNDGKVIRLNLPELTEDRRKDLVKEIKKEAEKCRIDIRKIRRTFNEEVNKSIKEKTLSEDNQRTLEDKIQKLTDNSIKEVEKIFQLKEKEILEI